MLKKTLFCFAFAGTILVQAQTMIMRRADGGNVFIVPECGVVLTEKDNKVTVNIVMPMNMRTEAYKDVDLKEKDSILMFNGKLVKSTEKFKETYESLEPGDKIALGVKRNEEMFIVEFDKADPDKLPNHKMIVKETTGSDGSKNTNYNLKITEEDGKVEPLMSEGLILQEKDDKVVLHTVLPSAYNFLGTEDIHRGDQLVSVNNRDIHTIEQFQEIYNAAKTGDSISFKIKGANIVNSLNFNKPKRTKMITINKD